jgi:hypothetical protein
MVNNGIFVAIGSDSALYSMHYNAVLHSDDSESESKCANKSLKIALSTIRLTRNATYFNIHALAGKHNIFFPLKQHARLGSKRFELLVEFPCCV